MKLVLLPFFMILFNSTYSQGYFALPDSGVVWVNAYSHTYEDIFGFQYSDFEWVDNYCMHGSDTVIGSLSYKKVEYCNANYKGAIRDNGGQVFFVPKDSTDEFLIYDFTVDVGDTLTDVYVHSVYSQPAVYDYTVSSIDSLLINGDYRTVIYLTDKIGQWIEGIGCNRGLLADSEPNISDFTLTLECMSHNDTILYPTFAIGTCALDLSFTEPKNFSKISIFPNPTAGKLEISGEKLNANSTITIVNSMGQNIDPLITNFSASFEIDLTNFPGGIYFVTIINEGNFDFHKIVKE